MSVHEHEHERAYAADALLGLLGDVREHLHRIAQSLSGRDPSIVGGGRALAPAAGTLIATTDVIPEPGLYEIVVNCGTNNFGAADTGVFELRIGNQMVLDALGGGIPQSPVRLLRRLNGYDAVSVYTTLATGSQCAASIIATRIR